jgi:regulatory protein
VTHPGQRRPRESFAERRARRAEVDDPAVVLEAALRFLEARQRSVAEVRRRLTTAGYREELVTGAIERLGDLGMLDDGAFATQWVESRDRARPRGERALRQELRQKGIDSETIAATLEERNAGAGDDGGADDGARASADDAAAGRLLARHAHALDRIPDPRARRQRAYALLARNGFGPEVAGRLASRVAVATDDDAELGPPD